MNKAGYVAIPVACGWAGAVFEVGGRSSQAKDRKKTKQKKLSVTDGQTDGRTDGRTAKAGCRVA